MRVSLLEEKTRHLTKLTKIWNSFNKLTWETLYTVEYQWINTYSVGCIIRRCWEYLTALSSLITRSNLKELHLNCLCLKTNSTYCAEKEMVSWILWMGWHGESCNIFLNLFWEKYQWHSKACNSNSVCTRSLRWYFNGGVQIVSIRSTESSFKHSELTLCLEEKYV